MLTARALVQIPAGACVSVEDVAWRTLTLVGPKSVVALVLARVRGLKMDILKGLSLEMELRIKGTVSGDGAVDILKRLSQEMELCIS